MGFTFGNRLVVSKDPQHAHAVVDGDGAGVLAADHPVAAVPSKQTSSLLPPASPSNPIARTASLFPWRKSKRQERNPEVSEAEARAVLATKRQEPPFEIHIPSTPHRSHRATEAPYSVVPAATTTPSSSPLQPAPRRIGSDIPIHALPVVMTEKELNPCLDCDDDYDEDTTTNPSCTDLDLSSTTEEGFETLGGNGQDSEEVMGRAGTPVVWEMDAGDNPRVPRVPIVHVKVSKPSPQRTARRSQSPIRMMVTPKESAPVYTTPLSPPLTFTQAAAAAAAASTAAVVTPPSHHQARAAQPRRMSPPSVGHSRLGAPPPNPRTTGGPDRDATPLPFDQPERFMELTHAVRRMLVATCEQDNDDGPDNPAAPAAAAPTTTTASSTPIAKNSRPSHASRPYEQQSGPATTSPFGLGLNGIQGYMPAYWDAPCGAGAYRPAEQPPQQQSPTPPQSGASCHPVLMGEVWQQRPPPTSSNRISPAATASLLCRPPPGLGSWTCGTMSPSDGRPCVTGVLSVDDMETDSLVDEEDRHQPPPNANAAPSGATPPRKETVEEIQDPEEERAARSSGAANSDPAPVGPSVVQASALGSVASASPGLATKGAPEAEARERSSSPRVAQAASGLPPDDHPDDERVASTPRAAATSIAKPPNRILLASRASRSSSAPPSPGRVRFDDNPREVRYLKSEEDENTVTCASLVENSVTDPSEVDDDEDDDDDLYDDEDDDDDEDLYDDSEDVESMDSAEYVEFLRHRKERRFDDCSASAAEQSGCSEHYAEYQVRPPMEWVFQ
jgi:hypothetical protein